MFLRANKTGEAISLKVEDCHTTWAQHVAPRQALRLAATQIIILFLLTSCAPAVQPVAAQALLQITSTPVETQISQPTPTLISPSPTVTQIPCDPFTTDFCITDGHFLFQNPIKPPANTSVDGTYRYGGTQNGMREPHHGVDLGNPLGTPVHAAADGVVQFAGSDKEARYSPWKNFYGNVIVIKHENDLFTLYGHLSKIEVKVGQQVQVGDKIGEVGSTGVAIGSHLHFEVRRGGDGTDYFSTQNPELWLIPQKDDHGDMTGAISLSILDTKSKFQFAEFTARYYLDKSGPKIKSYYVDTYPRDMALGDENAALGELPPGYYYIALKYNGHIYERWVEVESDKLTNVVFVVN